MRTCAQVRFRVTRDADQLHKLVDQGFAIDDSDAETSAEFQGTLLTLAAAVADYAVPFGGVVAASALLIIAYDAVNVKLNGVGTYELRPTPAAPSGTALSTIQRVSQPGGLFLRGRVESVHLTNQSAIATVDVFVALVGNAA
jgi:hypothetical protein